MLMSLSMEELFREPTSIYPFDNRLGASPKMFGGKTRNISKNLRIYK